MPRRKRQPTSITYAVAPGTRWWAYLRHSPGPNQDIASQRRAVEDFARERGVEVVRWFVDAGVSGAALQRDGFESMVSAAGLYDRTTDPTIAGVLVYDLSRFGRDEVAAPTFIGLFRLCGYQVVPVMDHDHLPAGGMEAVFEAMSHYKNAQYLKDVTAHTRRGLAQTVQQQVVVNGELKTGFSGGGFPPVGYRRATVVTGRRRDGSPRVNAYWEPDDTPDEWGETPWIRVRRAWHMMATGNHSYRDIEDACHLFEALNTYNDFFRRRTYLGIRLCGDVQVDGAHPAAVDRATFDRVQDILDGRLRPYRHPEVAASPYLLSGLFVCGHCGETIVGQTDPRRPGTRTYMCNAKKRKNKNKTCRLTRCPAWLLEQAVLDAVLGRVLTPAYQARLRDEINAQLWTEGDLLAAEAERLEREHAALTKRVETLLDKIEEGSTDGLLARLSERERERAAVAARLAEVRRRQRDERPAPVTEEEMRQVLGELRELLMDRDTVPRVRAALERFLVPRGSKLFDEAVELRYTFPLAAVTHDRCGGGTPSGIRTRDLHLERVTS